MNNLEKQRIIDYICSSEIYVTDLSSDVFIIKTPSIKDKAISSSIYESEYIKAVSKGVMTENQLLCYLIQNNRWSIEKNDKIKTIKDDIYKITRGLIGLLFNVNKLKSAKSMLREAEKSLISLLTEKNLLLTNTCENYASLRQQRYLISKMIYKDDGNLFWKDDESFNDFYNIDLIDKLTNITFIKSRVSVDKIREIARTQPWRNTWSIFKSCGNLFSGSPIEWTENQIELVSWSQTYDMAYEAYERPSKNIIEDNDLLDSWFIRQSEKIEDRSKNEITKDSLPKTSNKNGRQELFIVSDQEGSKEVYGLNDAISRVKIRANQSVINKTGAIGDQLLPTSQEEMRMQLTQGLINKHKGK